MPAALQRPDRAAPRRPVLPGGRLPHRPLAAGAARGDHARPRRPRARSAWASTTAPRDGLPILQLAAGRAGLPRARLRRARSQLGDARVSLHPAGHVLGSAQVRIEVDGEVWVASGDYKRQPDPTCAPFEVVRCDTFITEATFGLPVYRWPRHAGRSPATSSPGATTARARGEAAILFCYALGKAQRVLAELAAHSTDQPGAAARRDRRRRGGLPRTPASPCSTRGRWPTQRQGADFAGELVLAPPSAAGSPWMRRFRARSRASPRAGCASAATAAGATTTAASSSPTTPTGRTCCAPCARPARARDRHARQHRCAGARAAANRASTPRRSAPTTAARTECDA